MATAISDLRARTHPIRATMFSRAILAVGLSVSALLWPAPAHGQAAALQFDRDTYSLAVGQGFSVQVLISPVPLAGLFSYGFNVTLVGAGGQPTNFTSLVVPGALNHNGVKPDPAVITVAAGLVSAKGTADFFAQPFRPYAGSLLGTITLTSLPPGNYILRPALHRTLGPAESVFLAGDGSVLDAVLTFRPATVMVDRALELIGSLVLNLQTGLFEQKCRLRNTTNIVWSGFNISLNGLPAIVSVANAAGKTNGVPYVRYNPPLAPDSTVDLTIEFFVPDRRTFPNPTYLVSFTTPTAVPPPSGTVFPVSRTVVRADGTVLVEFATTSGVAHFVQYSDDDGITWKTAEPLVNGTGQIVQWLDNGPPKTETRPPQPPARPRSYRIVRP